MLPARFIFLASALALLCPAQIAQGADSAQPDVIEMVPARPADSAPVFSAGEGEEPEEPSEEPAVTEKKSVPAAEAPEPPKEFNVVRLQGLNKVTARVSTLEAPLGTVMRFGNLEIIAARCWQSPPEDRPENAALLEIRELKDEGGKSIFTGWMYSSSPGLSALEHPVYDITVLSCEYKENPEEKD